MKYLHQELLDQINELKKNWNFEDALKILNWILLQDPYNEQVLMQIADIQYINWEIWKAEKAIDFLLKFTNNNDPKSLYIKWVLEMEKTNWHFAKKYLKEAIKKYDWNNPEILRCFWLSEYWLWNRESWIEYVLKAHEMNNFDAEIIYNIIELFLLENDKKNAKKYIDFYYENHDKIQTFWNDINYYDQKISLFEKFLY